MSQETTIVRSSDLSRLGAIPGRLGVLIVVDSPDPDARSRVVVLDDKAPTSLNRLEIPLSSGLGIQDPLVSRSKQGHIERVARQWTIVDGGSANPSLLDGLPVQGAASLSDGAIIQIGDTFLVYREVTTSWLERFEDDSPYLGISPPAVSVKDNVSRFASSDLGVLVNGPTGSGKELIAHIVHDASFRKQKPFVSVDCGGVPDNLFESEFFGTERGAYTDAQRRDGYFQRASGGTLFLDEVENLSLASQIKLLRVLETKTVKRLGSTKETTVDVRLVAATNQDLYGMVRGGTFRADLYYRLSQLTLSLPSLAERKEDIGILVYHFFAQKDHPELRLSPFVMEVLLLHDWPGNVRELRDMVYVLSLYAEEGEVIQPTGEIHRAMVDKLGPVAGLLSRRALGSKSGRRAVLESLTAPPEVDVTPTPPPEASTTSTSPIPTSAEEFVTLFEACDSNLSKMARRIGKHRVQMYRIASRLGVDIDSLRS